MKKQLAISALVGVITFGVVFKIARIEPLIFGILFGAINAGVIFCIGYALKCR